MTSIDGSEEAPSGASSFFPMIFQRSVAVTKPRLWLDVDGIFPTVNIFL